MTFRSEIGAGVDAELVSDDELIVEGADYPEGLEENPQGGLDAPADADVVRTGDLLAGRYRVERVLGPVGLGVAVNVRHPITGDTVVLKYVASGASAHSELAERFLRAARLALKLRGEHVARVTDVGRLEAGAPYAVMEHLDGSSLLEILRIRGALPVEEAVDIVLQACEGLAELHALGVSHRRLSPAELVVTRGPDGSRVVKVLDCALSDALDPFRLGRASVRMLRGERTTLRYTAPEQIREAGRIDGRADIRALGLTLMELVSGVPAYSAQSATALLAAIVADDPASFRALGVEVPEALERVVSQATAKAPEQRFATLADFAQALEPFTRVSATGSVERVSNTLRYSAPAPPLSRPVPPFSDSTSSSRSTTRAGGSSMPASLSTFSAQPERRWLVALGIAGVAVAFVALAIWGVGQRSQGEEPATPAVQPLAARAAAPPSHAAVQPKTGRDESATSEASSKERAEVEPASKDDASAKESRLVHDARTAEEAKEGTPDPAGAIPVVKRTTSVPAPSVPRQGSTGKAGAAVVSVPVTGGAPAARAPSAAASAAIKAPNSATPAVRAEEPDRASVASRGAELFDEAR